MNVELFLHALQTTNMLGLSSIIDGWDLRKYWKWATTGCLTSHTCLCGVELAPE